MVAAATVESRAMRVVFTVEMQIPNYPRANMHRPYVCAVCAYSGGFESLGSIHGREWCTFPNVIILARGIVRRIRYVGFAYTSSSSSSSS